MRSYEFTAAFYQPGDYSTCGAQEPRTLRIEYQAMPGAADSTRLVRTLEFK
jgi:hypothetical protein